MRTKKSPGWARLLLLACIVSVVSLAMLPERTAADPPADAPPGAPRLQKTGSVTQLLVNGQPFLALGGELGNSTASDLGTLAAAFDHLQQMRLNTVMLPVYWDRIEPAEGRFDLSLVQGAVDLARGHNLHLVLLWFGTWKNSMSCYVPGWAKRDTQRFFRARRSSGEAMEIISPECSAAWQADAQAFAMLLKWVKGYDADRQTVVMVQVENEIGMIPEPRDHCAQADRAYGGAVPAALLAKLPGGELGPEVSALWEKAGRRSAGTWAEVFGTSPGGQEVFTAWEFATFVQHVAAAGKQQYSLPIYANAALIRPSYLPGQYPSGGPLPHLMEVWRAGAPSLDMLSPDIYFPNFSDWARRYTRDGNPLFIPETAPSARATANVVDAIANLGGIGVGPFAIENVTGEKAQQITSLYGLLGDMQSQVLTAQRQGTVIGLCPQVQFDWRVKDPVQQATLGGIVFHAEFDAAAPTSATPTTALPTLGVGRWEAPPAVPLGAAMVLRMGPEEFVVVGKGVTLTFAPADGKGIIGIEDDQEGGFLPDGNWSGGRWLNGDETHQGRHLRFDGGKWTAQRVTLYRYQ